MTGYPLVGIAYRRQIADEVFEHRGAIDCLEILVEHFLPLTRDRRRELERLREEFPLIPHGVGLSLGSTQPPPPRYLEQVRELVTLIEAPYFGDHASLSRAGGYDLHHLSPLWRTRAALAVMVENVKRARDGIGVPIAIETITEWHALPGAEIPWDEFLVAAAREADADLLIDVTNIWINRANGIVVNAPGLYGILGDARWRQFHLAGITRDASGFYLDSHDAALGDTVLEAYREALRIQPAPFAIVERDSRLDFGELLADLDALRRAHDQELVLA